MSLFEERGRTSRLENIILAFLRGHRGASFTIYQIAESVRLETGLTVDGSGMRQVRSAVENLLKDRDISEKSGWLWRFWVTRYSASS